MSRNEFSVCQFFKDGGYDYEARFVGYELAMETWYRLTINVAARAGITRRVIITDGGDFTCLEWKYGEGITFPPELAGKALIRRKPE